MTNQTWTDEKERKLQKPQPKITDDGEIGDILVKFITEIRRDETKDDGDFLNDKTIDEYDCNITDSIKEEITSARADERAKWINGFLKWAKEQKISNKEVEDCLKVIENG